MGGAPNPAAAAVVSASAGLKVRVGVAAVVAEAGVAAALPRLYAHVPIPDDGRARRAAGPCDLHHRGALRGARAAATHARDRDDERPEPQRRAPHGAEDTSGLAPHVCSADHAPT